MKGRRLTVVVPAVCVVGVSVLGGATCQRSAGATTSPRAVNAPAIQGSGQRIFPIPAITRTPLGAVANFILPERPRCDAEAPTSDTVHTFEDDVLQEVSGLAASATTPGLLWAVADSGNAASLYGLAASTPPGPDPGPGAGSSGVLVELQLPQENIDFEDLALGPCPDLGGPCIYVADTGNNDGDRTTMVVYAVPEPTLDLATLQQAPAIVTIDAVWILPVVFPDEEALDVEALAIFPDATGMLFIEKTQEPSARVFLAPPPWQVVTPNDLAQGTEVPPTTLVLAGTFTPSEDPELGGKAADKAGRVTAAAMHWSGTRLLVRTTGSLYEFRGANAEALLNPDGLGPPVVWSPVADELQGESVTWDEAGTSIFTISEAKKGASPTLHRIGCLDKDGG